MNRPMLLALLSAACFAGVASTAFAKQDNDQTPDKRIGDEVDRICFGSTINGWKTVDKKTDDVVLLQKGVNDWYYVELLGTCDSSVLRSAEHIGIESRPAGGCITRGDTILVRDHPDLIRRCAIQRMYKWDDKAPAPDKEQASGDDASTDSQ